MLTYFASLFPQGPQPRIAVTDLVARIQACEEKIQDIQCHMTCTVPKKNEVLYEADWGYDHGKLFMNQRSESPFHGLLCKFDNKTAFDGQRQWHLNWSSQMSSHDRFSGCITKPHLHELSRSFHALMGFWATATEILSLSQTLAQARSVRVIDREETIDGHPCLIIEVSGLQYDPEEDPSSYAVRAWIDTQRDYRLLRHELYRSMGAERPFKKRLWYGDHIQLAQIQGIWLPVQGECIWSGRWLGRSSHTQRLTIDVNSFRLNQGIPVERFSIRFPKGCEVHDRLLDRSYVVGEPSEQEAALSATDWKERMAPLSVQELIAVLGATRLFIERHKWFAAIHRLVEIGSAAVPELGETLRHEDKPTVQSKLAFTLRAIGDPDAVPVLIDGLERLTGHSEGQDHFHFYKADGDRMGSGSVTPETMDRYRQRLRAVAQRWRQWWHVHQGTVQPAKRVDTRWQPVSVVPKPKK